MSCLLRNLVPLPCWSLISHCIWYFMVDSDVIPTLRWFGPSLATGPTLAGMYSRSSRLGVSGRVAPFNILEGIPSQTRSPYLDISTSMGSARSWCLVTRCKVGYVCEIIRQYQVRTPSLGQPSLHRFFMECGCMGPPGGWKGFTSHTGKHYSEHEVGMLKCFAFSRERLAAFGFLHCTANREPRKEHDVVNFVRRRAKAEWEWLEEVPKQKKKHRHKRATQCKWCFPSRASLLIISHLSGMD